MEESSSTRPAKRCKVTAAVNRNTVKVFSADNVGSMWFRIEDFANKSIRRAYYLTESEECCGRKWKLRISHGAFRGSDKDTVMVELIYVSGCDLPPIFVEAEFSTFASSTHTHSQHLPAFEYKNNESRPKNQWNIKRDDIVKDCDEDGSLFIFVSLKASSGSIWYPKMKPCDTIGPLLYQSATGAETSDFAFIVGRTKKSFKVHKCILAIRAKELYNLTINDDDQLLERSSSSSSCDGTNNRNDNKELFLPDINADAFEVLLKSIYTNELPKYEEEGEEDDGDRNDDEDIEKVKEILVVADRFHCTDLKLYAESILVDKFLSSFNAASLLLFADSHSCALLKEATMKMFASNFKESKESNTNDWEKLKQSNDLVMELLLFTNNAEFGPKKEYSCFKVSGDVTPAASDSFDVTSLRERLQGHDLDADGSREMLLQRWKQYLRSSKTEK